MCHHLEAPVGTKAPPVILLIWSAQIIPDITYSSFFNFMRLWIYGLRMLHNIVNLINVFIWFIPTTTTTLLKLLQASVIYITLVSYFETK